MKGNPGVAAGHYLVGDHIDHHVVVLNVFATFQLALGLGIAWRPTSGSRSPRRSRGLWPSGGPARVRRHPGGTASPVNGAPRPASSTRSAPSCSGPPTVNPVRPPWPTAPGPLPGQGRLALALGQPGRVRPARPLGAPGAISDVLRDGADGAPAWLAWIETDAASARTMMAGPPPSCQRPARPGGRRRRPVRARLPRPSSWPSSWPPRGGWPRAWASSSPARRLTPNPARCSPCSPWPSGPQPTPAVTAEEA